MNVYTALWPVDSFGANANDSLDQKLQTLSDQVDKAYTAVSAAAACLNIPRPLCLFAAPEYYFIKGFNSPRDLSIFDEAEKKRIYAGLKAISKAYPRVILVPGTVCWGKPRKTAGGSKNDRWVDGYNTAPVYYNGSLHHEYDKRWNDANYSSMTTDVLFQPGANSPLFKLEKLKFGIEVCGDFDDGNLAKAAAAESLDIEIYISGYNKHSFDANGMSHIPVRNGGYFIHCEAGGKEDRVGVWLINRGQDRHGPPLIAPNATLFDPWTTRRVNPSDPFGMKLSLGTMIWVFTEANYQRTQSVTLPAISTRVPVRTMSFTQTVGGTPAPMPRRGSFSTPPLPTPPTPAPLTPGVLTKYQLVIDGVEPSAALNDQGDFRMKFEVRLTDLNGDTPVQGKAIQFGCDFGTLSKTSETTGVNGKCHTVLTMNKNHVVTLTAKFLTAAVRSKVKVESLGAGSVSKMSKLLSTGQDELPCWHLLV